MLALLLLADPLDYLGLKPGGWFEYTGFYSDSSAGDPRRDYDLKNRTDLGDEFTYQGHRALVITSVDSLHSDSAQPSDTVMSSVDTAYADSPWVRLITDIGIDTSLDLCAYRVPFTVGDRWSTGAEGQYVLDLDDDGNLDTLYILRDTVTVETLETVEVPAGTYDAYKLVDSTLGFIRLYTGDSGKMGLTRIQWWTPGVGMVRDSAELIAYVYYGSYLIPYLFQWRVHELTAAGVEEGRGEARALKVLSGAGWLGLLSPEPAEVELYSASGRLLRRLRVSGARRVELKPGVYFVKTEEGVLKGIVR